MYFVDFQKAHRQESLTITDAGGNTVAQQRIGNFSNGKYYIYDIRGPVFITIRNEAYPNAVLSGIFTD